MLLSVKFYTRGLLELSWIVVFYVKLKVLLEDIVMEVLLDYIVEFDVLLIDELFDEDSGFVLLVDYTSIGQISVLK